MKDALRRDFLKFAGIGMFGGAIPLSSAAAPIHNVQTGFYPVRSFGAAGDGKTLDSPAINRAIEEASKAGGGTVYFAPGTYLSYSIRLKSNVALYLDQGATLLAAETPPEGFPAGSGKGYDEAEPKTQWDAYQDYGHNHWHNSLIWGEGLHDIAILGTGLIWGKGLSRGIGRDQNLPVAERPGVGNKSIALKDCRNVLLRDFSILKGGHFGILATGVDNMTIDNLKIDTDRDGMDIDCCRNVRVSNCSVNSPWDDGICPKSSFALGYARSTENVTITNCYVTAKYQLGTLLDGTFKEWQPGVRVPRTGRIKCGTESNGGFKNITISNCVFEGCNGLALESVDGALLEDITVTNITMRELTSSPLFLRLGSRMRGPTGVPIGKLRRVLISNIVSSNCTSLLPAIISGIPGSEIEDIKISDVYFHAVGGAEAAAAKIDPPEDETRYPDPHMFGALPAYGFFLRHISNLEMGNIDLRAEKRDSRPAIWMNQVRGADFFRLRTSGSDTNFAMRDVSDFRIFGSKEIEDKTMKQITTQKL